MAAIIEGMAKKIEAEKDFLTQLDNELAMGIMESIWHEALQP